MGYNYDYPYTDPEFYNNDWMLKTIKETNETVKDINGKIDTITRDVLKGWLDDGTFEKLINEELLNDIKATVETNFNKREERNIIVISDSYGNPYYSSTGLSFLEYMKNYAADIPNLNFYTAYVNGGNFGNFGDSLPTNDSRWFPNLINTVSVPDPSKIDSVVVAAGYNDRIGAASSGYATSQLIMNAFVNYFVPRVKAKFPNAKIYIAPIGWSGNSSDNRKRCRDMVTAYSQLTQYGASYITNSEFLFHYYAAFNNDGVHPNALGMRVIARNLLTGIVNGSCDIQMTGLYSSCHGGKLTSTGKTCYSMLNNDVTYLTLPYNTWLNISGGLVNNQWNQLFAIVPDISETTGTSGRGYIMGGHHTSMDNIFQDTNEVPGFRLNGWAQTSSGLNYNMDNWTFVVLDGWLWAYVLNLTEGTATVPSLTDVSRIQFKQTTVTLPTLYC